MSEKHALDAMKAAEVGSKPTKEQVAQLTDLTAIEARADRLAGAIRDNLKLIVPARGCAFAADQGLQYLAVLRFSGQLLDDEMAALKELTNAEYARLAPEKGMLTVVAGLVAATLKRYTKPARYEYPPEIQAQERQLMDAKKRAVADGTAKLIKDAAASQLFSLSVAPVSK